MLTRVIVDLYARIIEVALWLFLVISLVAGYFVGVPMLEALGWDLENEAALRITGALLFVSLAFLVAAIVTGPFLVLVDIRNSVRAIETKNDGIRNEDLRVTRREPTL